MGAVGGVGVVVVLLLVLLVVVGGVVGLFALRLSAGTRQRQRHEAELRAYAATRGFSHRPGDQTLVDRFRGDPFGRGHARVVQNVLGGRHGDRPVLLFEYRWTTGSGDDAHRHLVRVLAVALPTPVPRLELVRSSTFGTLADALSGREHRIGDPVFDAAYRIFTDSPEFATDVLDPALRAWLHPQQPPYFRLRDADLVVVAQGGLSAREADRMLAFASGLLDRVPARVWDRAAGGLP